MGTESSAVAERLIASGTGAAVLLRGGAVVTMDPGLGQFASADVLIEDGRIAEVAEHIDRMPNGTTVVDASASIVMPGFVDGHRHSWQGSLRRLATDADLPEYLSITHDGVAAHYRPEDMYIGNLVSMLGALDAGFTTVLDFSHNSRSAAHSDAVFRSYRESGIRAIHASAPPNAGEWDNHWPGDLARLAEICASEELITLRLAIDMRRVRPVPELMSIARSLGLGIHMDGVMGEGSSDEIVELGHAGLLGPDVTIVHATSLGETAWRAIERAGVRVVLATTSDEQIGLASGMPPIQRVLDAGIRPALSIDVEIALAGDMFTQMRTTLMTQRMFATLGKTGSGTAAKLLSNADVLEFATMGGAVAGGLGDRIGSLTVGKEADVLLIAADGINNLPGGSSVGTIVQGSDRSHIRAVFVGGVLRKWGGQLVGIDLDSLRRDALESREFLFAKAGFRVGRDGLEGVPKLRDVGLLSYLGSHSDESA
ncbi:MAG: amidohydrolase [Glaciihabitans sp.]|nr:amidohydrolase [Glaciihabitans sp.]